jgi:hypothetical protein
MDVLAHTLPGDRPRYRPALIRPRPLPTQGGPERRSRPRIPQPPLHVGGLEATVEDVSEGGICLRSRTALSVGDRLTLILTDGTCYYTKELVAEVQWSRAGLYGLIWVQPTPGDREWLRARFAQWPGRRRLQFDAHRGAAPTVLRAGPRLKLVRRRRTPERVLLRRSGGKR